MSTTSTTMTSPRAPQTPLSRFATLQTADRLLCGVLIALSLFALALGIAYGVAMALVRSGLLAPAPDTGYRVLTLHGTTAFFYWLYTGQAATVLLLAAAEKKGALALRGLAWAGTALIAAGFVLSELAAIAGPPLLYEANPELGTDDPRTVAGMTGGYLLLAAGFALIALSSIATVLATRRQADGGFSALGFGLLAWAGFLIVSAVAAVNAFLPGLLWASGFGAFPHAATTDWHILFHNLHYLPLMATVLVWYALAQDLTGISPATGTAFSKIVFASYLVFVPPTSLYHMFLEPGLPESVRVAGSLLSLFVSVPTLIAFLIVVASLEIHTRAGGEGGMRARLRRLPWDNPAMANMGVAILTMLIGLAFAFVLIQEKLAPLLSDTMFVPGYFHFFAVGTVTQSFIAMLAMAVPAVSGRPLWRPRLLCVMPWIVLAGLLLFGAGGLGAGLMGVPRRVVDIGYGGEAPAIWRPFMAMVGIGGVLFASALAVSVFGVLRSLVPGRRGLAAAAEPHVAAARSAAAPAAAAWTGPLAVVLLVAAMYGATIGAFELMQSLPVTAAGGGAH